MNSTINLFAICFSVLAFITSNIAIIMVLAQKWSTHKIEWKPLSFDTIQEEEDEQLKEEEDAAELLDKALSLSKQANKKKKLSDPLDDILETNNF